MKQQNSKSSSNIGSSELDQDKRYAARSAIHAGHTMVQGSLTLRKWGCRNKRVIPNFY